MNLNKRVIEDDNVDLVATKRLKNDDKIDKINEIIIKNFNEEIVYKQHEIQKINERIFETQNMLDKLRALVLCRYYSLNGNLQLNQFINHPALLDYKSEMLDKYDLTMSKLLLNSELFGDKIEPNSNIHQHQHIENFKEKSVKLYPIKLCVGNVSKYLNINKPQKEHCLNQTSIYDDDLISHKWMIYVRSPNCKNIEIYIKKVVFHLHQSYKPNDIIEISKPPFQLTKRGWGEFPVHVQIHFKDARNKRMDIIHQLKLDWTLTGLQTFGGETLKEAELNINGNDYIKDDKQILNKKKENNQQQKNNETEQHYHHHPQQQQQQQKKEELINETNVDDFERKQQETEQLNTTVDELPKILIDDLFTKSFDTNELINNNNQPIERHHNYDEDDYELINPTTAPIVTSCIDELILDLTNNSFDLSNHNSEFENNSNLIDTFLTNHSSMPATPSTVNETFNLAEQNIPFCQQQYDESSLSSTTSSSTIAQNLQPVVLATLPHKPSQIKSSIDDLLNLRLKSKPLIPNLTQQIKPLTSTITLIPGIKASKSLPSVQTTIKSSPNISISNNLNKSPSIATITSIKPVEFKSSPKQQQIPQLVQQTKSVPVLLQKQTVNTKMKVNTSNIITNSPSKTKSRPQITPVVKNESHQQQQQQQTLNLNLFKPSQTNNLTVNNQNKKCVIYKIESKDLDKNKPEAQKTNMQNKQQKSLKKDFKPQNQCLNPLLTDHNTSLLTKMKSKHNTNKNIQNTKTANNNSNNNHENKIQENINNNENKNKTTTTTTTTTTVASTAASSTIAPSTNSKKLSTNNSNPTNKQNETKLYTINDSLLNDVVKTVNNFDTYESYIKIAQKYSPLISKNPNKVHLPFCATSLKEYFSWPFAKRRANEWMRALNVKKRVNSMISKLKPNDFLKINQWSTKNVLIWLRAYGYTPLDHVMSLKMNSKVLNESNSNETRNNNSNTNKKKNDYNYISSLTPFDRLLLINEEKINLNLNEEKDQNDEIDVVGENESSNDNDIFCKEIVNKKLKKHIENIELNKNYDHLLEMSNGSKYVKEQLNIIDIKTNPVNLSTNVACKLTEEFIFAVTKRFCESLIRDTCANIYNKNLNETKSNNNNTNNLKLVKIEDNDHYLTKINVLDVFNTICDHDKYDFLTNKYMANINNLINENNKNNLENNNCNYDIAQSKIK